MITSKSILFILFFGTLVRIIIRAQKYENEMGPFGAVKSKIPTEIRVLDSLLVLLSSVLIFYQLLFWYIILALFESIYWGYWRPIQCPFAVKNKPMTLFASLLQSALGYGLFYFLNKKLGG